MNLILGTALIVLSLSSSANAQTGTLVDVKAIQAMLAQKKAGWQAKDSWVNRLSKRDLTQMMGLKNPPTENLDFSSIKNKSEGQTIDWRNHEGVNWLGPIMNQGGCGSCVAFTAVATLEARVAIASRAHWLRPTFSPAQLFSCGGGSCDYGWWPEDAAKHLVSSGVVDAACMPYTSGSTGEDQMCNQSCSDGITRTTWVDSFSTPTVKGGSVEAVKEALKSGPLMTTLRVYADFMVYSGGVYKHVTGPRVGAHAVSLVGFDDKKQAWLIRNSWGTNWGERGFAWVSWEDTSGVGSETWALNVTPRNGLLSVGAPLDRELISGAYELKALGVITGTLDQVQFHIKDSANREVKTLSCTKKLSLGCATSLASQTLTEGRYEISVTNSQGARSQVRDFYVLNSVPRLSAALALGASEDPLDPMDASKLKFDITTESFPVPIQRLEFRILDSQNRVVGKKMTDYVLPRMRMDWKTSGSPNGDYKVQIYGETKYKGRAYSTLSNLISVKVNNPPPTADEDAGDGSLKGLE